MKTSWAKKWVADLRAHPERQGFKKLRVVASGTCGTSAKYCCLGRACVIAGLRADRNYYDGESYILPESVRDLFGMCSTDGNLPETVVWNGQAYSQLSGLNDAGMPFDHIADVIWKYRKEL